MFVLKFVIFLMFGRALCLQRNATVSQKGALIMIEEGAYGVTIPEHRASYGDEVCDPLYVCIPISSCPLLEDLLDKSCLASNKYFRRLTALTCGWRGGESLVCCPPGGMNALASGGQSGAEAGGRPPGVQADEGSSGVDEQSAAQQQTPTTCGSPMVQARAYSGIGSHPWVARIGFINRQNGQTRYPCAGSIISQKVILTAAHCALAKAEDYKLASVLIGEFDTTTDGDCGDMFCAVPSQTIPISHVIVHPGYDRKIYRHDVALIVLKYDMKYTMTSLPICLAGTPIPSSPSVRAVVLGWGKVGTQRVAPSVRQTLSVPLVPLEECRRVYETAAPLSNAQLCAGGEDGRDACSGFGGAPLVLMIDGRYTQIGIVSFGSEKCGTAGVPSVYTNVYSYANWIRDNAPAN